MRSQRMKLACKFVVTAIHAVPDLILLETLYLSPYFKDNRNIHLRKHEIDSAAANLRSRDTNKDEVASCKLVVL